jgi:RHS repeat-associated protein
MTDAGGQQVGATVKYLPFGCTRSGSVPTDKLFTGQRLDGTGLYYYNARYYDATIGRFISPDTVIPNPANPQCFNRYSYCLNNPLKFTDPSGHKVIIDNVNYEWIDWAYKSGDYMQLAAYCEKPLVAAFNAFSTVATELTSLLLHSPIVFSYEWAEIGTGGASGPDRNDMEPGVDYITLIGSGLKNEDPRSIIGEIAHESFHNMIYLKIGCGEIYAANEAFAWSYGISIAALFGYDMYHIQPLSYKFLDINPNSERGSSDDMIDYAGKVLVNELDYNDNQPYQYLWPMGGREQFLEVAQNYWPWK